MKNNKELPTAKELYLKSIFPTSYERKRDEVELWFETDGHAKEHIEIMIEFAKLHVEKALKQASETCDNEIEKDFITSELIINSYSLHNIK